jgi:hypothetical protein
METFSRATLPPFGFSAVVRANGIELPRPLSGKASSNDFTAGGYVAAEFRQIPVVTEEQHRYWNRFARKHSNGRVGVIVPIINDDLLPDGTIISASLVGNHILNAGTLTFSLTGTAELTGGEWFAIQHPVKNWRAYCIWTIDEVPASGGPTAYTVGIQPPLREATLNATALDFAQPRFLGQLAPGTDMRAGFDAADISRPTVSFVERFEVD